MKKIDMRLNLKTNIFFSLLFFAFAFLLEVSTFLILGIGILPQYFLFNFSLILFLASIIFIVPNKKIKIIVSSLFLGIQGIFSFINIILYNIYGDLFAIEMIRVGNEAMGAFDFSDLHIPFLFFISFFIFLYIIAILKMPKKDFKGYNNKRKKSINFTFFALLQVFSLLTYNIQYNNLENISLNSNLLITSDHYLYKNQLFKTDFLEKFGSFPFYFQNARNNFKRTNLDMNDYLEFEDYLTKGVNNQVSNPYSGLSEDNNVIVIMAESLEWFGIDPYFTPTLYEFMEDSYVFDEFYSKNKTNISEANVILGNSPKNVDLTESKFKPNREETLELPFSMPNMLREDGYESIDFFHNYFATFFGREDTHQVFGFDNIIDLSKMDIDTMPTRFHDFTRDSDMIKSSIDKIVPTDESFFSFVTTVIGHGPYDYNYRLDEFYEALNDEQNFNEMINWMEENTNYIYPEDEDFQEYFFNYKATAMDLDYALNYLLNDLEEKNLRDDTSIVLYSDHYAYYHGLTNEMKDIPQNDVDDPELYRIPFMINDSNLDGKKLDTFTTSFNISATIFDLLGVEFNQNLYAGHSVFDPRVKNDIFLSKISGIIKDGLYFNSASDILDKQNMDEDELLKILEDFDSYYQKSNMIDFIYEYNIFEKNPNLANLLK